MSYQLTLNKRSEQGSKAKALRKAGLVASVIYGAGEPVLTSSVYNETEKALSAVGYHSPVELQIDGQVQLAIVKSVAIDPVSRRVMNIEFQAVSESEVVEASAPIVVKDFDKSEAAKKHYTLLQVLEEVAVKAKPSQLPKELIIDGSKLNDVEDRLTLADIEMPNGVELVDAATASEAIVANVYDPAAEAAAREAEETQVEPVTTPEESTETAA